MERQTPFIYRDFYDRPRLVFFNHRGHGFLFDSRFNDGLDKYEENYSIYVTQPRDFEELRSLSTWTGAEFNTLKAEKISEVNVFSVPFDETRRKTINIEFLDNLLDSLGIKSANDA